MDNIESLKEGDICPRCKEGHLVIRNTAKGEFLGCSNFPDCDFIQHNTNQSVIVLKQLKTPCPLCSQTLEIKLGRFGIYIGCSNYPLCHYNYKEDDDSGHNILCPICKKGSIVKRRTAKGRIFYACDNFPACKFSLQGKPIEKECPICNFPLMFLKKTAKGEKEMCPNTMCKSRQRKK